MSMWRRNYLSVIVIQKKVINATHYLSPPPPLTLSFNHFKRGGKETLPDSLPIGLRASWERFEQVKREGESSEVVFDSVVPARQTGGTGDERQRKRLKKTLEVGHFFSFVTVSLTVLVYY